MPERAHLFGLWLDDLLQVQARTKDFLAARRQNYSVDLWASAFAERERGGGQQVSATRDQRRRCVHTERLVKCDRRTSGSVSSSLILLVSSSTNGLLSELTGPWFMRRVAILFSGVFSTTSADLPLRHRPCQNCMEGTQTTYNRASTRKYNAEEQARESGATPA